MIKLSSMMTFMATQTHAKHKFIRDSIPTSDICFHLFLSAALHQHTNSHTHTLLQTHTFPKTLTKTHLLTHSE